jgi:hypothetical protein
LIFVEDLKVKTVSSSAKETVDQPGKNVKGKPHSTGRFWIKAGLNSDGT